VSRDIVELTRALHFAAEAHRNQRRKGAAQEPYVNHLIEVLDLVARGTGGDDLDAMLGAVLHDVVEDTGVTRDELAAAFGDRVAEIVVENSDDMSVSKAERKRRRIAAMPHKSAQARMVKNADVISNVRAVVVSAPAGWGADRKLGYLEGCRNLVDAGRGANADLERIFDETAAAAERAIRDGGPMQVDDHLEVLRELENAIGEPVHKVYLPNTQRRALGREDVETLADILARQFPSATIQRADAIFEGALREVLIAHIRTESTGAIVAFAQSLCLAFDQRFVGIEVGGRYIRVYADDTG
jgi:hypothetical protein